MLEKLALQKKYITNAQCSQALDACKGADNLDLALKDYFEKENILSEKQIKILLATYSAFKTIQKNQVFGNCAVKLGLVNQELFQEEMDRQKAKIAENKQPRFIGKVWQEDQTITPEQYQEIIRHLQKETGSPAPSKPALADKDLEELSARNQEDQEDQDHTMTRELDCGVILEIDATGMMAFIKKTSKFKDTIPSSKIIEQLQELGICYGIAESFEIEDFIDSTGFKNTPFRVARGTDPVPGKDARIEYFFETDHLKAGGIDEDGNMDFMDRGPIPWVKKGTLLAKKYPMIESCDGRNIFNQEIPVPPAVDCSLKFHAGAMLSPDGLELHSEINGCPTLDQAGKVHVSLAFTAPNDIDFQTGHIDYHGDIVIKGTLKAGFKAMGHVVRAGVVDGGEIEASGDVTVLNGMIGGTVYSRGNVSVKFIQNSTIFCLGNLTVDKEILDSRIVTSGAVFIQNGEIISSTISCNKGLFTRHLGTEKSVANVITLGVDAFTTRELKQIQSKIDHGMERQEQIREKIDVLYQDVVKTTQGTLRLVHEIDRARHDSFLMSKQDDDEPSATKSQIQTNKRLLIRLDKEFNGLLDRMEKKKGRIEELKKEGVELANTLELLKCEQENFSRWQQRNPGQPQAFVTGQVIPGTIINGPDISKEIMEVRSNVKIMQTLVTDGRETSLGIDILDNIERT